MSSHFPGELARASLKPPEYMNDVVPFPYFPGELARASLKREILPRLDPFMLEFPGRIGPGLIEAWRRPTA